MANLPADLNEIRRAVALFLEPGLVIELRVPKAGFDGTISGYFSDPEKLALAARQVNGKGPGVYVTLNPVRPDLIARADNRVKPKQFTTTRDPETTHRRWLLIDFDPERPKGTSSTEEEHALAIRAAKSTSETLAVEGWPFPVCADSGNGGHLLYRIDLPNDDESTELVANVLKGAAQRFGVAKEIDVDLTVSNASRISKLYGTAALKGDSTPERPHRLSCIISRPDVLEVVTIEHLQALAGFAPEQPARPDSRSPAPLHQRRTNKPDFNLEQWLLDFGVRIHRGPVMHGSEVKWVLENCPFNPEHAAPDAAIFRQPSGRLGFKCFHASCAGKDWSEFRDFYEPQRSDAQRPRSNPAPPFIPMPELSAPMPDASDGGDKIPIGYAAVEEAADVVIAGNDIAGAMRLIPALAALRPVNRVVIVAKLRQHFKRVWKDREFTQALNDAIEERRSSALPPPDDDDPDTTAAGGPDLLFFPMTDAGNGERLVAMFGDEIRYCVEMKCWLVWDGVRWVVDQFDVMRQKMKAMARLLFEQAKRADKAQLQMHARNSEAYGAGSAALACASSEKGIRIHAADLDQHPYLLNCLNGVVNLRDGKILRHNREFLITKLCPVAYKPDAECPKFIEFVQWAMGANLEAEITDRTARLVGFLQRAFGYALTADVTEKAVFICYGKGGNNGKTTLLTIFRDLLGKDYSGQIAIETVMSTAKQQDATMRADLADLRGVRLVVTSEVERESRLNEGKIKYITAGSAPIKSCRKYENPIEFWATHKLFMDCNHRPIIRGSEDAIWKRLKLIPFEVQIPDEDLDRSLPDKLRTEMPGILAWAVRGALAWSKDGLGEPPEVKEAGMAWREHDDPLKEFLEDCCEVDLDPEINPAERMFVTISDLTAAYENWAKQNREKFPMHKDALRERMEAKGFKENRSRRVGADKKQARTWEGLQLRTGLAGARYSGPWPNEES